MHSIRKAAALSITILAQTFGGCAIPPTVTGEVQIRVVEPGHDQPLPCRVHLRNQMGKPERVGGLPFWRDHFVFGGDGTWQLPHGDYTFAIERGPETFRFHRDAAERPVVEVSGSGDPRTYPVRYLFGVTPLQQVLLERPAGRLQALPIAWATERVRARARPVTSR